MIQVLNTGAYKLIETKDQTKILVLETFQDTDNDEDCMCAKSDSKHSSQATSDVKNKQTFAWINVKNIGEILVTSHKEHLADTLLAVGNFRKYDVKDEPTFSDQQHLELSVGCGKWQGYLLPTGLPTNEDKRNRVIPTKEIISSSGCCEKEACCEEEGCCGNGDCRCNGACCGNGDCCNKDGCSDENCCC